MRLAVKTGDHKIFQQLFDASVRNDLLLHDAAANHQSGDFHTERFNTEIIVSNEQLLNKIDLLLLLKP
jgi:hypothetical protein